MDPGVPLIINDIEPEILHMWREFLEEKRATPSIPGNVLVSRFRRISRHIQEVL
jgi:hypothetical protein